MKVSVIITCYNEGHFVSEALESVLSQTSYDQIEQIIIVDDGSTDNTRDVVTEFLDREKIVQYMYQENQGLAVARNTGIAASNTGIILFLDADDIWVSDKLEKQLKVLEKFPDVGIIYSDTIAFSDTMRRRLYSRKYQYEDGIVLDRFFVKDAPIVPSTVLIRKECFDKVGVFDPELRKAQDTEMWHRILGSFKIQHIDEPLVHRRFHDSSLSANYELKREYMLKVIDKTINNFPRLEALRRKRLTMLDRQMAKERYMKGKRLEALRYLVPTIIREPAQLKGYLVLIVYILPIPYNWVKASSRFTKF